jgi:hypothetical protein
MLNRYTGREPLLKPPFGEGCPSRAGLRRRKHATEAKRLDRR